MYEESGCYNPNSEEQQGTITSTHHSFMEEQLSYHRAAAALVLPKGEEEQQDPSAAMDIHQQLLQHVPTDHNDDTNYDHQMAFHYTHLPPQCDPGYTLQDVTAHDVLANHLFDHQQQNPVPGPEVMNLLQLSRCSASTFLPNAAFLDQPALQPGPDTPSSVSSVLYDPVFHLNLPPQPPFFKDLFQSLPAPPPPYLPGSRPGGGGNSLFGNLGEDDNRDGMISCLYQDGDMSNVAQKFDGGVFEFARDMTCLGKGRRGGRKVTKHFTTERERRVSMNARFDALRQLVPRPSKDRASILADAIDYIKELLRTVGELKLLVEKKRRRNGKEGRNKRHRTEGDGKEELESSGVKQPPAIGDLDDPSYGSGSVRTSWLQRKSKDTEVDVRVIDDEVTVKLVWRKKINCLLLFVSKALDELQLDLHHVAGGHIGDHCCFLFNTKIYEGSSVYASAIANKLIAVVDGQFAAATPATASCY